MITAEQAREFAMTNRKLCEKYIGVPVLVHYASIILEYTIRDVSNGLVKYTFKGPYSKCPNLIFSGQSNCALMASNIRSTIRRNDN